MQGRYEGCKAGTRQVKGVQGGYKAGKRGMYKAGKRGVRQV